MNQTAVRAIHVLALGMWFGGAGFFNFVAAPTIFESFKQVVHDAPSDRTAFVPIVPPSVSADSENAEKTRENLANALAGSAVGPVFPKYFAMQAVCGIVALCTAISWWNAPGKVHRWRVYVLGLAALTVAVGWALSNHVSEIRPHRFDPDRAIADAAKAAFATSHLASLFLSFVTVGLAGIGLALAGKMPAESQASN